MTMHAPSYCLADLFDQLGLESSEDAINAFIRSHQLTADTRLENAPFWNPSQVEFFVEARNQDADWVELVDELDTFLHQSSMRR